MNDDVLTWYRPTALAIEAVTAEERVELERRERAIATVDLLSWSRGRVAILVDDELATSSSCALRSSPCGDSIRLGWSWLCRWERARFVTPCADRR
jgi:hypothetical protein